MFNIKRDFVALDVWDVVPGSDLFLHLYGGGVLCLSAYDECMRLLIGV